MPRERSPERDEAKHIWLMSKGKKKLKEIAAELGVGETQVRKWKSQDKWDRGLKSNVTNQTKGNVTNRGAPKGNKNALGNRGGAPLKNQNAIGNKGGTGGPPKNAKAIKHGLFRKYLPDDEETQEIYDAADQISTLDLLWESIRIKWTAIIRAQKIMWVRDQDDIVKVLKKEKSYENDSESSEEKEWEFQFPWDRQANFLNAQARAMGQLTSMIRQYEELLRLHDSDEEQHLRIEELKVKVENLKGGNKGQESEEFAEAIKLVAERRKRKGQTE